MTHYESDCGAATKVAYTIGQTVTVIVPAVNCSRWQGFRGKIIEAPTRPACRSQMDIQVDGNWQRLVTDQIGFHVIVTYGDYLREVGYALKKVKKIAWDNLS
jgi:heme A synthase